MKHMLHKLINIYKPICLTPLQLIHHFRAVYPEYAQETISPAGRLDPLADGVLLLLIGETNKDRRIYQDLPKTYTFQILFGISTDSYDTLGIPQQETPLPNSIDNMLEQILRTYQGRIEQHFPPYSSKPVQGKPLYWWARNGKLSEITLPKKYVTIENIQLKSIERITKKKLAHLVFSRLTRVQGNFRQEIITTAWQAFCVSNQTVTFPVATITITCSSGTYIRQLAQSIGQDLGCGALALTITRTAVGDFTIEHALRLQDTGVVSL